MLSMGVFRHVQHGRGQAVGAVDAGAAAAGAVVVEFQVDPRLAVGMVAAEAEADLAAAPGRWHAAGQGLGHGAEHGLADAESGQPAGRHRRRVLRVDEAALGRGDVEGAEEAAVGLDGRVDEALHHGVDVGLGVGEVGVDAALGLRRGAVEVHKNFIAVYPDVDVYVYGLGVDAVVVYVVNEVPLALRQRGNLGAGEGLGSVENVGHVALHFLKTVFVHQPQQVALAESDGGEESLHVAEDFVGNADVLLQDAPDSPVQLALLVELEGREDEALLVDFGVVAGVAASHAPADVGLVADAAAPAHQDIVDEDGLEQEYVGQVAGALVGVVVGENVAGFHVVAKGVHHSPPAPGPCCPGAAGGSAPGPPAGPRR